MMRFHLIRMIHDHRTQAARQSRVLQMFIYPKITTNQQLNKEMARSRLNYMVSSKNSRIFTRVLFKKDCCNIPIFYSKNLVV